MTAPPRWQLYLRLGRVSNLPTVWSNVLAGYVLGGAAVRAGSVLALGIAISSFYVGGMFLNDAFDREIDARERPERPIPAGLVSAEEVTRVGFGLLGAGLFILVVHALVTGRAAWPSIGGGVALGGAIVVYDLWHKGNPASPLLMGLCRMLVYVTAAVATSGRLGAPVLGGAVVLLSYLVGLTYVAKQENLREVKNLWPLLFLVAPFVYAPALGARAFATRASALLIYLLFAAWVGHALSILRARQKGSIPRAVVSLIAGISLCDALLIATAGSSSVAALAVLAFPATLSLQRYVSGT